MSDAQRICEEALRSGEQADVIVLQGQRRPLVNAAIIRMLVTIMCAGVALYAAAVRESASDYAIDALALLLRVLALGFFVRAGMLARDVAANIASLVRATRCRLAIAPEGLLLEQPSERTFVLRTDVIAVVLPDVQTSSSRGRARNVSLVLGPGVGRTHVTLPDVFDETPTHLAERLMRWRGEGAGNALLRAPQPDSAQRLASEIYERASRGDAPPNVTAVHLGLKWLRRGPYTSSLLGVAMLFTISRAASTGVTSAFPLTLLAGLLLAFPIVWILLTRRTLRSRRGLVLVLTPEDLLLRARDGTSSIALADIRRTRIDFVASWSLIEGYARSAKLVVERRDGTEIHIDEELMKEPIDVVLALCTHYRANALEVGGPYRANATSPE